MIRRLAEFSVLSPSGPELSPEEREIIRDLRLRHFILFKRHFVEAEQVRRLIEELKIPFEEVSEGRGLLMVDQEGGRVQRIGPPLAPEFPGPLSVARRGPEAVENLSRELARSVKAWGLHVNLAPVLDLAGEEAPDFLRGRTLGEDPLEVARLGRIFIRAHLEERVFPCAKHFPGLGGVETDPHRGLPVVKELSEKALKPFREAISGGVPFVMTTHLVVRKLSERPVTFSEEVVRLLRRDLGFDGPVLTDDLAMEALKEYDLPERFLYALLSGHTLWLYCGSLTEAVEALLELAREAARSRVLQERMAEAAGVLKGFWLKAKNSL